MNLRSVTIWTTWLVMIGTLVAPYPYLWMQENRYFPMESWFVSLGRVVAKDLGMWLFYGSPLLVSWIIARRLKHPFSQGILLLSVMGYGFCAAYAMYMVYVNNDGPEGGLFMFFAPMLALPWTIPIWIIALILNSYYVKNNPNPGTATSTSSSSAPLK